MSRFALPLVAVGLPACRMSGYLHSRDNLLALFGGCASCGISQTMCSGLQDGE